jgi:hypothetical protein
MEFADAVDALSAQKQGALAEKKAAAAKQRKEQRKAKQEAKVTYRVAEHLDEFPALG